MEGETLQFEQSEQNAGTGRHGEENLTALVSLFK